MGFGGSSFSVGIEGMAPPSVCVCVLGGGVQGLAPSVWGLRGWLLLQCGVGGSSFSVEVEGVAPSVWGVEGMAPPSVWGLRGWLFLQCGGGGDWVY